MIISRTPYRVSFAGGGTDLPAFTATDFGAVLSATIDHYIYVTVHRRFEPTFRISYSKTEIVATVDDIQHDLVREVLRVLEISEPLEITTVGDIPAGTGMGSSGSLTVGLLTALFAYRGITVSNQRLAELACQIEINRLRKPIGYQDQYAAAFGGLNYIQFNTDATVNMKPVGLTSDISRELERSILLFYTGKTHNADNILTQQSKVIATKYDTLVSMREIAVEMYKELITTGDLERFAKLLHTGWELKRSLGPWISLELVDEWYAVARRYGATGGKLLGAGSGGFLLIMAPAARHSAIGVALGRPREVAFKIANYGSRNIFIA